MDQGSILTKDIIDHILCIPFWCDSIYWKQLFILENLSPWRRWGNSIIITLG